MPPKGDWTAGGAPRVLPRWRSARRRRRAHSAGDRDYRRPSIPRLPAVPGQQALLGSSLLDGFDPPRAASRRSIVCASRQAAGVVALAITDCRRARWPDERVGGRTVTSAPTLRNCVSAAQTRLWRRDRPDGKQRCLRLTRSRQRRCDLATAPRGAIAGHGGLLKLIFRADSRRLLGVHCFGDIASEVVSLGHVVLQLGGRIELFLTLALNTPTYCYAYHDATVDGLTRLTKLMGIADGGGLR
jgi:hypothetical protein